MWCGWQEVKKKKKKGKVEEGSLGKWECQLCVALMSAVLFCFSDTCWCSFHPTHCDSFKSARTHRGWWQSRFTGAHLSGNHKTRGPVWGLASQSEKCFSTARPRRVVRAFKLSLPHSLLQQNIHGILYARRCQHQRFFFSLPKITYSPLTFWWFKNPAFGACVPAGVGSNPSQQSELPLISALRHCHLCCSDRKTKICAQHWRYHMSQTDWANTIECTPYVFFNPALVSRRYGMT